MNKPKVISFSCNDERDRDHGIHVNIRIAVPDTMIGASIIGHVSAIVAGYEQIVAAPTPKQDAAKVASTDPPPPEIQVSEAATDTESESEPEPVVAPVPAKRPTKTRKKSPTNKPASARIPSKRHLASVAAVQPVPSGEDDSAEDDSSEDDVSSGSKPPKELAAASSFKEVMIWMVEHGFNDVDTVVAKCEEFRDGVEKIRSVSGKLAERVAVGLAFLEKSA